MLEMLFVKKGVGPARNLKNKNSPLHVGYDLVKGGVIHSKIRRAAVLSQLCCSSVAAVAPAVKGEIIHSKISARDLEEQFSGSVI